MNISNADLILSKDHLNRLPSIQATVIEKPGLIILHDWKTIQTCMPIRDWPYPIKRLKPDYWSHLDFDMNHSGSVAMFKYINAIKQPRISLTGVGLYRIAVSLAEGQSFDVEKMVDRIFGQYSDVWSDAEGFLGYLVPYLSREAGTLSGTIPRDNGEWRAIYSTQHERQLQGRFWEAQFGPPGCGGQMPESWHRWREAYLDRHNMRSK